MTAGGRGGGGAYLTPPVVLGDGEVVRACAAGRGQAVELRGQVGEVAVQVQILGILPSARPPVVAGTLKPRPARRGSARPPRCSGGHHRLGGARGGLGGSSLALGDGLGSPFAFDLRPLTDPPTAGSGAGCSPCLERPLNPLQVSAPTPASSLCSQFSPSFFSIAHVTSVTHRRIIRVCPLSVQPGLAKVDAC